MKGPNAIFNNSLTLDPNCVNFISRNPSAPALPPAAFFWSSAICANVLVKSLPLAFNNLLKYNMPSGTMPASIPEAFCASENLSRVLPVAVADFANQPNTASVVFFISPLAAATESLKVRPFKLAPLLNTARFSPASLTGISNPLSLALTSSTAALPKGAAACTAAITAALFLSFKLSTKLIHN